MTTEAEFVKPAEVEQFRDREQVQERASRMGHGAGGTYWDVIWALSKKELNILRRGGGLFITIGEGALLLTLEGVVDE